MTRVLTEGFEGGDARLWTFNNVATDFVRSGSYAHRSSFVNASSQRTFSASSEIYLRVAVRVSNVSGNSVFSVRKGIGGNKIGDLFYNANLTATWRVGGTTAVATTVQVTTTSQYQLWEVHLKIHDTAGIVEIKCDGVLVGSASNVDTKPGTDTTVDCLEIGTFDAQWTDDIAVNDTNGSVDNSWCGDGHILALTPNAAGYITQWSPSGTAVNWQNVDDIPANSDTDYNITSITGTIDSYSLSNTILNGINVNRVWIETVARNDVADGSSIQMFLRTSGTSYNDGSGTIALTTSYARYVSQVWTLNPYSSLAWTIPDINALEVGVKS